MTNEVGMHFSAVDIRDGCCGNVECTKVLICV